MPLPYLQVPGSWSYHPFSSQLREAQPFAPAQTEGSAARQSDCTACDFKNRKSAAIQSARFGGRGLPMLRLPLPALQNTVIFLVPNLNSGLD